MKVFDFYEKFGSLYFLEKMKTLSTEKKIPILVDSLFRKLSESRNLRQFLLRLK